MGREIKRVALDFKWPEGKVWKGYAPPPCKCEDEHVCGWKDYEPPAGEGWQAWENVSDGSPVTPVFATAEALADYLVEHEKVSRAGADAFVKVGHVPSMVISGNGQLLMTYECAVLFKPKGER